LGLCRSGPPGRCLSGRLPPNEKGPPYGGPLGLLQGWGSRRPGLGL
jgi:hypothetical protein